MNDTQKAAYRDALKVELDGLERRIVSDREKGNANAAATAERRIGEVKAEIGRVGGRRSKPAPAPAA